jgi:hypothetical protein
MFDAHAFIYKNEDVISVAAMPKEFNSSVDKTHAEMTK